VGSTVEIPVTTQAASRAESSVIGGFRVPDFRAVFDEYAPFVWRVLRRLGVPEADVPDACQDAFLVVSRRLTEFDGKTGSLKTWAFRIAVRVASDYRRRARTRARRETPMEPVPETATMATQPAAAEMRDKLRVLDALLANLDEDVRDVFVLHDIEELPMSEVAIALGCPLQTGYSRLHAARRDLEAQLNRARARKELP
jgi:RNA polymerase sigma-70 factor (ECF subfamily)